MCMHKPVRKVVSKYFLQAGRPAGSLVNVCTRSALRGTRGLRTLRKLRNRKFGMIQSKHSACSLNQKLQALRTFGCTVAGGLNHS